APRCRVLRGGKLPGQTLPRPIVPEAPSWQPHLLLLLFPRPSAPSGIACPLARGHRALEPPPIDQHDRWWVRQPRRLERLRLFCEAQHQPVTGRKRPPLPSGAVRGLLRDLEAGDLAHHGHSPESLSPLPRELARGSIAPSTRPGGGPGSTPHRRHCPAG